MSKTFMKYLWLIDVLKSHGKMTLEQINEEWKNCYLNETKKDIPLRTFHNYVDAIQDIFKFITITCDRKDGYTYRIEENNYYQGHQGRQILSMISGLFRKMIVANDKRLKDRICDFDLNIYFPDFFDDICKAIDEKRIVSMYVGRETDEEYARKLWPDSDYKAIAHHRVDIDYLVPIGLIKINNQWYLIGRNKKRKIQIYNANSIIRFEIVGKCEDHIHKAFNVVDFVYNYKLNNEEPAKSIMDDDYLPDDEMFFGGDVYASRLHLEYFKNTYTFKEKKH